MAGNPCKICSSVELSAACASLVSAGVSDRAIAAQIGASRAGVQRHRIRHIVQVARAIVAAGAKDTDAKARRQEILTAAENGTLKPEDYLSLSAIVTELKSIGARLDRTATAAEMGGVHPVVVSAAAQQIRLNESKARLAGHGGFAPARARDGAGEVPVFSVTFNFSGKTE